MNDTLKTLPPELEAKLDGFAKEWIDIGLQTGPPDDRILVKEAVREIYRNENIGDGNPSFEWFPSPMAIVDRLKELGVKDFTNTFIYGNLEAMWIAFRLFCMQNDIIPEDRSFLCHAEIAKQIGVWAAFDTHVFISERLDTLKLDDNGRLHSENGPAMAWPDGVRHAYWHGTHIPMDWVLHPERIPPETALNHENAEMRRCAAEIMGWGRVLEQLDPTVIDTDDDPQIGQLLEAVIEGNRERFLAVKCGTGRDFVIPVVRSVKTALEANAWTYGLEPDVLKQYGIRT